jgi:hypothetical protein
LLWLGRSIVARPDAQHVRPLPAALTSDVPAPSAPFAPPLAPALATPAAPAAPAAPEVSLAVDSRPPGAEVILDGVRLGRAPISLPIQSSPRVRELRIEMAGFRTDTRHIVLARPSRYIVELVRLRPRAHAPNVAPGTDADIKEGR